MKRLIPLFLILLSVQFCSCSGITYSFGESEHKDRKWESGGYEYYWSKEEIASPWGAVATAIFAPALCFSDNYRYNGLTIISGVFWILTLMSGLWFMLGYSDDMEGIKRYYVRIGNKTHYVEDWRDAYSIEGTGSVERGYSWSDRTVCFILCASILGFASSCLFGLFDDINMLIKVTIVGSIIYLLYLVWNRLLSVSIIIKLVAWGYCAIDFALGVIITLINN